MVFLLRFVDSMVPSCLTHRVSISGPNVSARGLTKVLLPQAHIVYLQDLRLQYSSQSALYFLTCLHSLQATFMLPVYMWNIAYLRDHDGKKHKVEKGWHL